ncbi:hypothetical protein EMIT051CA3_50024 [Pseudomonas chlororaphis]
MAEWQTTLNPQLLLCQLPPYIRGRAHESFLFQNRPQTAHRFCRHRAAVHRTESPGCR